ncbi:hypothetical protein ACFV1W_09330 [Kitasatospora sp. NPDC059648]|uniref:hypothetical protein n=1 Tax=Kitasatospora sp. NPDC059648 TaxID=3346894 RepID=UPI0036B2EF02
MNAGGDEAAVGGRLHRRGWRKAFTVEEMVGSWAWLVGEVERGYEDDVDKYVNDLSCRNWLHEAWLLLDDRTVLLWTGRIEESDRRFREATVDDDGVALGRFHRIPPPALWWWRRHPRVLVGDLDRPLRPSI